MFFVCCCDFEFSHIFLPYRLCDSFLYYVYIVTHKNIKCKWDEIYDTEQELINDLFSEKILTDEDTNFQYKICKGYDFIKGFRKYYKKNGTLTEKQLTQLKRLASEIAYHVYCE